MQEGFQRGETVSFNVFVLDGDGNPLDTTGGAISVLVRWRNRVRYTLVEGAGLTVLDNTPVAGAPQAVAVLTAIQTATIPRPFTPSRAPKIQAKFIDSLGTVYLQAERFLDEVVLSSADVTVGGQTGPAGPAGPAGTTGLTGPAGATGAIGPAGPQAVGAGSPATLQAGDQIVVMRGSSLVSIDASNFLTGD